MSAVAPARPAARGGAPARPGAARTARWIFLGALLCYAAFGGGRIVGSDEVTMFQLARALARGGVAVPEGATMPGPDGRHYTKNAAGQAIAALPLVVAGDAVAGIAGLPPARRELASRFVASFFNAAVTALLLAAFYRAARALGVGGAPAFAATLLLGYATPVDPYAKSFMAEPLQALGLLLALTGAARAAAGDDRAARSAALGAFLAVSVKLVMLPIAMLALLPLVARRSDGRPVPGRWLGLAAIAAALAFHAAYNLARFGTPLESGYGRQAGAAAWSTPLAVGLYGLLLSSGKGLVWFAPPLALLPFGIARMRHVAGRDRSGAAIAARWAARAVLMTLVFTVLLYARFEHWAGDGSFGPRYLVPVIPLAMLAVAFALQGASRGLRRAAWTLGVLGALVQAGGVLIYFGAQMREAGDYPYTRSLSDPRFMESSRWNPRFSPILGHWSMAARNLGGHLRGELPRLAPDGEGGRLGLSAAGERALLHGLDLWWLYLRYAGFPPGPPLAAAALLMAGSAWAFLRAWRLARAEPPA